MTAPATAPAQPVEHVQQPKGRAKRRLRIVASVLAIALTAVGVALLSYGFTVSRSITTSIQRTESLPADTTTSPRPVKPASGAGAEAMNFVLMGDGTSEDDAGDGRSDTLLIAHLDADRQQAYLVSFPRNLWVPVPGHGTDAISAASSFGGPQLTVRTLESLLDVRMDHVAQVDYDGFVELTSALGGVTVTNDDAFSAQGFSYPKGRITLEGERALGYVQDPAGSAGDRADRQRRVTRAIMAKGLSGATITNPVKFNAFVKQLASHVTVDSTLTDGDIRSTALSLRLGAGDITTLQAPVSRFAQKNGKRVAVIDQAQLDELADAIRSDDLAGYAKKHPDR